MKNINPINPNLKPESDSDYTPKDIIGDQSDKSEYNPNQADSASSVDSVLSSVKARNLDTSAIYPAAKDLESSEDQPLLSNSSYSSGSDRVSIFLIGYYVFAILFLIVNIPVVALSEVMKGHFQFNVKDTISMLVFFTSIGLLFRKEWARLVVVICLAIFIFLDLILILLYSGVYIVSSYFIFQLIISLGLLIFLNLPKVRELCD